VLVAEIIMLVNSIDPLAPYKVSDDLILELVNVTALVKLDPEAAAAALAELRLSSRTIWLFFNLLAGICSTIGRFK
jgi:hypothetical protein